MYLQKLILIKYYCFFELILLVIYCFYFYYNFVKYFLEKNSNINLKNFDGNTPLHLALLNKKKCKNVINILMKYNPRLDIKNNNGDRAFDLLTDEMKIKYGLDKIIVGKEK